ncbi:pseudaminic acid synthase [Nonomuraea sp. NPDC050202]|jgi:N-acetylneuraminate synthase|uniref:pseudaminic acid synthase n=1 Tax=unclassified Nonomuraea TaxID=2593643 RepID=UPI0033CE43BA
MISIGGRAIGPGHPPFVVAELSGNHNGSLERALAIVDAVADAGAHALKLQTYTPDTLTIDCDAPPFRVGDEHELWGGESLYRLFERAHTPWAWHEPIFARARERGLVAFSAPFDPTAVELLEKLDAPAYKIASSEIVDLPLIRLAAGTGKPLIISTGMASVSEIEAAVSAAREAGCTQLAVLSCTASYPASPSESNLRALPLLAAVTGEVVGLSDHTPGLGAALAAVALGACLIEKHVTLSRADGGVDSAFSLEPAELAALVVESERAWESLGEVAIGPRPSEREGLRFRRSLYVVRDVRAGEPVTPENVRSIRPAGGLPPDAAAAVMGRRFTRDTPFGTPLTWDLI